MSAGQFELTFYSSNETGEVHPIRVQPETLTLSLGGSGNAAPSGPATNKISAEVGGSRRTLGLKARMVRVAFSSTLPDGYAANSIIALPWLQPGTFSSIARGTTGTYTIGGTSYDVVCRGTSPEQAN
jgi:hypothetical protein